MKETTRRNTILVLCKFWRISGHTNRKMRLEALVSGLCISHLISHCPIHA